MRRFVLFIAADGALLPVVCVVLFLHKGVIGGVAFIGTACGLTRVPMLISARCPSRTVIVSTQTAVFLSADRALMPMLIIVTGVSRIVAMRFYQPQFVVLIINDQSVHVRRKAAAYIATDRSRYVNALSAAGY